MQVALAEDNKGLVVGGVRKGQGTTSGRAVPWLSLNQPRTWFLGRRQGWGKCEWNYEDFHLLPQVYNTRIAPPSQSTILCASILGAVPTLLLLGCAPHLGSDTNPQ